MDDRLKRYRLKKSVLTSIRSFSALLRTYFPGPARSADQVNPSEDQ